MYAWTPAQFAKIQKIARRHNIHCPLRLAMVTNEDPDGTLVCTCNGKRTRYGAPKETTLAEVLAQLPGRSD